MVSTNAVLGLTTVTVLLFTGLGLWDARGRVGSVEDLITARNSIPEGKMTGTLIASVMGVWILLAAPEAGASFGLAAVVGYAIGEAVPMIVYSKIGPRIRAIMPEGHTITEYVYFRFGRRMYAFVIVVSALYMFIFLAAELTGIARALSLVASVPQWQTAVLIGGFVLVYTGYGGIRSSIFTDMVQALVVLPLLVVALGGAVISLGGAGAVYQGIVSSNPTLLDPGFLPGLQFGLGLSFAILGAELVNQTWWQRIYAGNDSETVATSFRSASVANGLIVFLAALFGLVAAGQTTIITDVTSGQYNADVAFFVLLGEAFPDWIVVAVVLLAVLLVISSVDSLFNALASLVTADMPRLLDSPDDRTLAFASRAFTLVVGVAAIYVSLRARSVLRLFFLADLLGVAVAFPLVYGLYSRRLTGGGALTSSLLGLAVGLAYFPDLRGAITILPVIGDVLPTPDPLYLTSFAGAFVVSTAFTLLSARISSPSFDHDSLSSAIHSLEDETEVSH